MGVGHIIRTWGRKLRGFARDLARADRGNVAMIFALSLPPLILMTLGGVDIHRASTVRVNLQDALDAATLAAARSPYTAAADIQRVGLDALKANLKAYPQITLREDQTTFVLNSEQVVVANSKVDVNALVANIFLPPYGKFMDDKLPVGAHSEVNRSSKNLEVALVLDITGSMGGSKIADLKSAAGDLVEMVVQDLQTPYYSKMSIVPYSMGVNIGSYAASARGAPPAARTISGAAWTTGASKSISGANKSGTITITSNNHGFANGDYVWISGVNGMTQLNNRAYVVSNRATNTFRLSGVNSSNYNTYSSGGTIRKCLVSDCSVVVTANNHGFADGDGVYITGVNGMTQINDEPYVVDNRTTNTFSIGVNGASWGNYSSGGSAWCGYDGCQYRVFRNPSGALRGFANSTCVSERTGAQAYTDASVTTAKVGRNYPSAGNECPSAGLLPLSSNKTTLNNLITNLDVGGSTGAQVGAAWGWYTVAPNFNGLWPSSSAGAYFDDDILKAVIIMTDGEFNTPYCTGVIAADAASGSGSSNDHINCDATNGDPFAQTAALCAAMKLKGVIVYTVGFQMDPDGQGAQTLNACASSGSAFLPGSGADLTEAFKAIGRDITRLRISK